MYPQTHFAFGLLFIILLGIFTPLPLLALFIILASSILIDVDHWFAYVKEKKNYSVSAAYRWCVNNAQEHKKEKKQFLCIFHTVEFMALMFILSFFSNIIFYITIGFSFHLLIDVIDSIIQKEMRKGLSIIYFMLKQ